MTLPLSRRTFLRRSAAAKLHSQSRLWFLKPRDLALAQEVESGIAGFIGKGLASGVLGLGNIGSMAFRTHHWSP